MPLPNDIRFIIKRLASHGFRADVVGGCVRDFLLGKEPNDYDLTTDATPDEMRAVFSDSRTVDTGIKHGTLTVIIDKTPYEITTYRNDGEYTDNRHPDKVTFTRALSEDLSRRDFTVNAMCYNESDGFTDLFGGTCDLEKKTVRAVGEPKKRFTEDALRILRALRFASTLGFSIEDKTAAAIRETKHLLSKVSAERIFTEWNKLIAGVGAYSVISENRDVIEVFIPSLRGAVLPDEKSFTEASPEIRELSIFALTNPDTAGEDYLSAMRMLKSDNKRRDFGFSVLMALNEKTDTDTDLRLLLVKVGREVAEGVLNLKTALGRAEKKDVERLAELLNAGACYRLSDLKINGNDLSSLGIKGKDIGSTLNALLYGIAEGKIINEREELLSAVARMR